MQDKAHGQVDDFSAALSMQAEDDTAANATRGEVHAAALAGPRAYWWR
jgi:hypothetical protein